MYRVLFALFLGLSFVSTAFAEIRTLTASETERYNKVTNALVAPCCWREAIAIHRSAEALQMLDEVEQLVVSGRSEQEIKAIYVARYGVRILADPPGREGQWLYVMPVALFCCLSLLAILRLRSLAGGTATEKSSAPAELIALVRMETEDEWRQE